FSPDGAWLAAAGGKPTGVWLWDTKTWQARPPREGNDTPVVSAISFSPDGEWVAGSSNTGALQLVEVRTGTVLSTLRGHLKLAQATAFSPDGQRLASAGVDQTIRVWDLRALAPRPVAPRGWLP